MSAPERSPCLVQSDLSRFVRQFTRIQEKPPNFRKCAAHLSHPLSNISGILKYDDTKHMGTVLARLLQERLALSTTLSKTALESRRSRAITAITADEGLLATGSDTGQLRVFDLQQLMVQATAQLQSQEQSDIVIDIHSGVLRSREIDCRQSISCLIMSNASTAPQAIVGFHVLSSISIYDLSSRQIAPQRVLESSGLGREGGTTCMLLCTITKTIIHNRPRSKVASGIFAKYKTRTMEEVVSVVEERITSENHDLLVAGSASGYLRCWRTDMGSTSSQWTIKMDPTRNHDNQSEVIAMWTINNEKILCINRIGTICLYSLVQFASASTLGTLSLEPACLGVMSLKSIEHKTNPISFTLLSGDAVTVGSRHVVDAQPLSRYQQDILVVLLEDSELLVVDFSKKTIIRSLHTKNLFISTTNHSKFHDAVIVQHESLQSVLHSTPVFSREHRYFSFLETAYSEPILLVSQDSQCAMMSHTLIDESIAPLSGHSSLTAIRNGHVESCMVKTRSPSFTFKATIIAASPTESTVVASEPLSDFLTSSKMGGSSLSQSSVLKLDWESDDGRQEEEYEVISVVGCSITLNREYTGPLVENGVPQVRISTALRCGSFSSSKIVSQLRDLLSQTRLTACEAAITKVASFPNQQMIALGLQDGTVKLFLPYGQKINEVESDTLTEATRWECSLSSARTERISTTFTADTQAAIEVGISEDPTTENSKPAEETNGEVSDSAEPSPESLERNPVVEAAGFSNIGACRFVPQHQQERDNNWSQNNFHASKRNADSVISSLLGEESRCIKKSMQIRPIAQLQFESKASTSSVSRTISKARASATMNILDYFQKKKSSS